jgi:sugar lactone lactonase YvrE
MNQYVIPAIHPRKLSVYISTFSIIFLLVLECISHAADMPAYERLQPVTGSMNAPTNVALDKYECLFVAESVNNRVLIYSQSGQYTDTISGLSRPISVAVDENVRIYIGNKDSGNVEVYDSGYELLFKLGSGDGEFSQPNDIEIAGTGRIYVADKGEHTVKVYNTDGTYNSTIGSPGNGDGQFHNPTSIAIDKGAGELIVLDHQLTQDMFGDWIEGARIQVFDMNGVFKRSFSGYGNQVGQMFRPQHVTVDGQGRLYVTDSFHNVVIVYDNNGTYLGDVYDVENPVRTPMGITLGGSNRLYVASLSTGKVEVYGVDQYMQMTVSPLLLTFGGQGGGSSPEAQSVSISNNGKGALNWSAGTNEGWITLPETTGSVEESGTGAIEVGVNLNGLTAGTYNGSVSISAESGATEVVNVELEVLPTPELSVAPLSLTFTSTNGSNPSSEGLAITNTGGGTLNWSAAKDSDWILMDKETGTGPDSISVTVDIASMSTGTYTGSITVTGEGALSSPVVIPVTLNIVQETGTINVTTSVAGATFTINGPASYSGSGVSWTRAGAPTGTYAIVYGNVNGYTTPSSQNQTLQAGGTISFHGEYVSEGGQQAETGRSIIVGAGPGESNEGIVKVFKADGTETGLEFIAHGYGYGVNIAAGDINKDGIDEIITAPGPGADNPAEIRIYDRNGNELTNLRITASQYKYGANVAAGDFNGDGYYEVVAGAGEGGGNSAEVKVFAYDPINNIMVDSGIDLVAYSSGDGVRVTAGDIDNDGVDEIITAPGAGKNNRGTVKVWAVETAMGAGQWSVSKVQEYTVSSRYRNSISIASGDVNGDGYGEVITGEGPDRRARDEIRIYDRNGEKVTEFKAYITKQYGVNVASGDLDKDGVAEIVAGAGPGDRNRAIVKIFDANGVEQARIKALSTRYGVNVAVGDLGL